MMTVFLVALVTLGCKSPTLTLLKLWQLKEWRTDRLCEHMGREGWLKQLYGSARPVIFGAWIILLVLTVAVKGYERTTLEQLGIVALIAFAGLSVMQLLLRKQRIPVWTGKATLLFSLCLCLQAGTTIMITQVLPSAISLPLSACLIMLCPIWVGLSWLLLLPIDSVLKRRIIKKAIRVRTTAKNLTVIGITGSVGKTTTKELLKHMLAPIGAIATPAHMNAEIGVARWITQVVSPAKGKSLPKILIVEMGAYRKGEIALLSDIVQPSIGIVTYVGSQHLALFGSREAICEAKGELLRALPKDGHAFLNADNDMVAKLKTMCRCPVTTVGTDGRADIPAFDIEETAKGIRFKALDTVFDVSLAGTHCVTSVLLAIGTARKLGMSLADIAKQLRTFTSLAGTFEVREMCGVTVLDDTYNLSPQSFKAAIEWAKGQPHARKVLISEGIIELGTDEGAIHRELARDANAVFERVIVTHPRFLPYFSEEGFDDQAMLVENAKRTEKGDLLVCVGRMPKSTIERLLPAE